MVEGKWYTKFVAFVASEDVVLAPPPPDLIDNRSLMQSATQRPRTNLIQSRDYYSVVPEFWRFIVKRYKPNAGISCRYKSIYSTLINYEDL